MAGTPTDPADVPNQRTASERAASERAASLRAVFASSPRPTDGQRKPGEWTGGIPLPGKPHPTADQRSDPAVPPAAAGTRRKLWVVPAVIVVVALAGVAAVAVEHETRKNHSATFNQDPAPTATAPRPASTGMAGSPIASGPPTSVAPTTSSPSPSPSASLGKPNKAGVNLALHARAKASSVESSAWPAADAVDGSLESRWSSAFADPQWIRVDLAQVWSITGVRLEWEHAHAVKYRVDVSQDARHWKTVYRTTSGTDGPRDIHLSPTPARYVRMYGTQRSGPYGYSLLEFEVR